MGLCTSGFIEPIDYREIDSKEKFILIYFSTWYKCVNTDNDNREQWRGLIQFNHLTAWHYEDSHIYMLQELLWWKWGPAYLVFSVTLPFCLSGIAVKITNVFDCIPSKIICTSGFLNLIGRDNLGTGSLNATALMLSAKLSVRTPASEVGDRHSRSNYTCNDEQNHDSCDRLFCCC